MSFSTIKHPTQNILVGCGVMRISDTWFTALTPDEMKQCDTEEEANAFCAARGYTPDGLTLAEKNKPCQAPANA